MKRIVPIIVIVVLVAAFGYWWYSPTHVLKRRTDSLLQTLTLELSTGTAARQMGVYSFNSLLAEDVELNSASIADANGVFARSEMESAYSWLCEQAKQTRFERVTFDSVTIDADSGEVKFTLKALVELPNSRLADGIYQTTFRWQKTDSGWLLNRADWNETSPESQN